MEHPLAVLLDSCNQRAWHILCAEVDAVFGKKRAVKACVFLDILFPGSLRRVKFCGLRFGKILLETCNGVGKLRLPLDYAAGINSACTTSKPCDAVLYFSTVFASPI